MNSGDVQFAITANDKSAIDALNRVDAKVKGTAKSAGGGGKDSLFGAFTLAGGAAIGIGIAFEGIHFAVDTLKEAVVHTVEFADSIQDASDRMETLTENTQVLRSIARRNGSDLGQFEKLVEKSDEFGRAIANNDPTALANAKKLGISTQQGKTENKVSLLSDISKGSKQLDQAARGQVLSDIFGAKLAPAIKAAADELADFEKVKQQMIERGTLLKDSDIATLADFKDELGDFADYLTVQFAPLLTKAIDVVMPLLDRLVQGITILGFEIKKNLPSLVATTVTQGPVAAIGQVIGTVIRDKVTDDPDLKKEIDATNKDIEDRRKGREDRKKAREEQRKEIAGPVNRTKDVPTPTRDIFKSEALASPGNTGIGGTAAIDVRFRLMRINEQILNIMQKMLDQLVLLNAKNASFGLGKGEFGK